MTDRFNRWCETRLPEWFTERVALAVICLCLLLLAAEQL